MGKRLYQVIFYGAFSNREGGVLIYNGKKEERLKELKCIKNKSFGMEEKKLYIAEGSFCETKNGK